MTQQQIILTRTPAGWLATFPDDPVILQTFGASTIPTAWTALTAAATVRAEIQSRWPARLVTVEGGDA